MLLYYKHVIVKNTYYNVSERNCPVNDCDVCITVVYVPMCRRHVLSVTGKMRIHQRGEEKCLNLTLNPANPKHSLWLLLLSISNGALLSYCLMCLICTFINVLFCVDVHSTMRLQKRLAAAVMKCGKNKIWLDPNETNEIANANSSLYTEIIRCSNLWSVIKAKMG